MHKMRKWPFPQANGHFYAQRIIAQKHTIRMDKILNSYYVNDKVCVVVAAVIHSAHTHFYRLYEHNVTARNLYQYAT